MVSNKAIAIVIVIWIFTIIFCTFEVLQKTEIITTKATATITTYVKPMSVLYTRFDKYSSGVDIEIKGYYFTPFGTLNLDIINSSNGSILNYPKNLTLDSSGNFVEILKTDNLTVGNYTIIAINLNNSILSKNKTFRLLLPYIGHGKIFDPFYGTVNLNMKVYDEYNNLVFTDDGEYDLLFEYGKVYNVHIIPINLPGIELIVLEWLVNQDDFTDMTGLDSIPVDYPDLTDDIHMDRLTGVMPLVTYNKLTIYFTHSSRPKLRLYKCLGWNFTARKCDGNWSFVKNITEGSTRTNITLYPGDPGFAIGAPPFCGDGIWDVGETLENCPEDYPVPPLIPRKRVSISYPTCDDGKQNQNESDIDCGGPCPPCDIGKKCRIDKDCESNYCYENICTATVKVEKPLIRLPVKIYAEQILLALLILLITIVILNAILKRRKKES